MRNNSKKPEQLRAISAEEGIEVLILLFEVFQEDSSASACDYVNTTEELLDKRMNGEHPEYVGYVKQWKQGTKEYFICSSEAIEGYEDRPEDYFVDDLPIVPVNLAKLSEWANLQGKDRPWDYIKQYNERSQS